MDKLYNCDSSAPLDVKLALEANFGGVNKEILADFLSWLMKYMKFSSADCNYINQPEGQGNCVTLTNAWTFPLFDVRVCDPNYWNIQEPEERSRILIHEWFHKYYISQDWEYNHSDKYKDLSTLKQLINADSFATLVYDICK
ncbi:MAG: hypothetical protein HOP11_06585 [Saprospiraceae bacterium]|nr:hypothetical protein [Saprospiraceae bacterium]